MYNFEEEVYKEVLEHGIYNMANPYLADKYVEELRSRGKDVHVVHAVGENGVRDIIFTKGKSEIVYSMLLSRYNDLQEIIGKLIPAIEVVESLIEHE